MTGTSGRMPQLRRSVRYLAVLCAFGASGCGTSGAAHTTATVDLNISGGGTGSGSVTAQDGLVACTLTAIGKSGSCLAQYETGTVVTLVEVPAATSHFTGWSGACSGTGSTCQVTLSSSSNVQAGFDAPLPQMVVSGSGSGAGSVTSGPSGISCTIAGSAASGSCTNAFPIGTAVTLTALASASSVFSNWAGDCTGTTPTCELSATGPHAVQAIFLALRAVVVTASGSGSGLVTGTPGVIACTVTAGVVSGSCGTNVADGTAMTLTATPAAGSLFAGWTGACTTAAPVCSLSVGAAATTNATFTLTHLLTITGAGTGAGTVSSAPAGIACTIGAGVTTGACVLIVPDATAIVLTATPTTGSTFGGWSGACSGVATCALSVTAPRAVTALFAGASSATTTSVAITPGTLVAGGAAATVTVTVRDAAAHPIAGATVVLSAATGPALTVVQPAAPTDLNGVTTGTVASTIAGTRTVAAVVNGSITATQQPQVVISPAAAHQLAQVGTFNTTGARFGQSVPTLPAVQVTDAFGNPVPGTGVTFLVAKGLAIIGNGSSSGSSVVVVADASGVARLMQWDLTAVATAGNYNATIDVNNRVTATVAGAFGSPFAFNTAVAVSYASDIQPIWSAGATGSCTSSGCHAVGGFAPVLVAGSSHAVLAGNAAYWTSGDSTTISNSTNRLLFRLLTGAPVMPTGFAALPANMVGIVKAYIKQGVPNN